MYMEKDSSFLSAVWGWSVLVLGFGTKHAPLSVKPLIVYNFKILIKQLSHDPITLTFHTQNSTNERKTPWIS